MSVLTYQQVPCCLPTNLLINGFEQCCLSTRCQQLSAPILSTNPINQACTVLPIKCQRPSYQLSKVQCCLSKSCQQVVNIVSPIVQVVKAVSTYPINQACQHGSVSTYPIIRASYQPSMSTAGNQLSRPSALTISRACQHG